MFSLKVEWKKRLFIGLINIIPMIALTVLFVIYSIRKEIVDGCVVAVIVSLVYLLGVKDILFFEFNKDRRLDYFGSKKEEKWNISSVAILIRSCCFGIIVFYFLICVIYKGW